jgi:intracellular multiplication protein IcmJ
MKKPIPIILGIARTSNAGNSRLSKTAQASGQAGGLLDPSMPLILTPELKKTVLERDDHTCQCCGFRSIKYQEVHFLDQNKHNLKLDNLATTCIFCHQCFNLDVATQMRSGVLIWLPEIEQATLNSIMQAIYVARISQGAMAEAARKALDALMARREEARRRIFTDDPYVLTTVLRDYLTSRYYNERSSKLDGIRLFPLDRRIIKETDLEFNQFPQILAYWRSKDGPFAGKAPSIWMDLYRNRMREIGAA